MREGIARVWGSLYRKHHSLNTGLSSMFHMLDGRWGQGAVKGRGKDGSPCPHGAKNRFRRPLLITRIAQKMCTTSNYDQYYREVRGPVCGRQQGWVRSGKASLGTLRTPGVTSSTHSGLAQSRVIRRDVLDPLK